MDRLLLASTALLAVATAAPAADLPRRTMAPAPMVVAVPAFTWTGLYVGVHGAWIRNETKAVRAETNLDLDFIPACEPR